MQTQSITSCAGCAISIYWPTWVCQDEDEYVPLCAVCCHRLEQEFTAKAALLSAQIAVWVHQGLLNAEERLRQ
jgi:hypothetical protein